MRNNRLKILFILVTSLGFFNSASSIPVGNNVEFIPEQRNLGVGTKSPQAKLDVNGSVMIRGGNPQDGYVLTSNANGLASWRLIDASIITGTVQNALNAVNATNATTANMADFATSAGSATNAQNVSGGTITNSTISGGTINGANLTGTTTISNLRTTAGGAATGKVLTSDALGNATWQTLPSGADNLGNHTATTNLNLSNNNITNVATITASTFTGGVFVGNGAGLIGIDHAKSADFATVAASAASMSGGTITNSTISDANLTGTTTISNLRTTAGGAATGKVLTSDASGNATWQNLTTTSIPNLDANKITSGTLGAARIPDLDANKITTGIFNLARIPTLDAARIPALDANKITTGIFNLARIPTLDAARIPSLSASKITTGTFDLARIPSITADKIATGAVTETKIASNAVSNAKIASNAVTNTKIANNAVTAAKISTSGLTAGRVLSSDGAGNATWQNLTTTSIPNLDANKITSGVFDYNRIPIIYRLASPNGTVVDAVRVISDGRVGIGTLSPGEKLEVNGNIRATNFIGNLRTTAGGAATGRVLTSDASGNATWQNLTTTSIPNLDANKITTGTLNHVDRIPSLPASKITSGTFHVDRIPSLPTSKITGIDTLVGNISKLVAPDGSPNPAVSVDNDGNVTMVKDLLVQNSIESSIWSKAKWGWFTSYINIGDGDHLISGGGTGTQFNAKNLAGATFRIRGSSDDSLFFVQPSNNRVGIGTQSPSEKLEVNGNIRAGTEVLTEVKNSTGFAQYTTVDNVGNKKWLVGSYGDTRNNSSGGPNSFYIFQKTNNSDSLVDQHRLIISNEGSVFIGYNNPGGLSEHKLYVSGSAAKTNGGSWSNTSDIRLKDVHGQYEYGLKEILDLNTVRFSYKAGNPRSLPSDTQEIGFIAQEVQKVIPDAVIEAQDGYLEFNIHPINVALVNAVKELKAEKDSEINDLKEQVRLLKELYCSDNPAKALCVN